MDQVHVIRHKVLVEGRTQRAVARELAISRVTVRKYLSQAALLQWAPRWTTAKQWLTATRLHQLLRAEGYAVGVTVVKEAVAEWKRQQREPLIPLTYRPGELYGKTRVMVSTRRGGGIGRLPVAHSGDRHCA